MTDEQIIKVLAKAQGYVLIGRHEGYMIVSHPDAEGVCRSCPDYLTSHDALQPIIDGLDGVQVRDYLRALEVVKELVTEKMEIFNFYVLCKATPRQKAEALVKALGKWEESK